MAIDYNTLKQWPIREVEQAYSDKDTMLYALSVGAGRDPLDSKTLRFVFERDLVALPTMAAVLGYPGSWMSDTGTGIDYTKVVHGESRLTMHRPLEASGMVTGRTRVTSIVDKGAGKGAVVTAARVLTDRVTGEAIATMEQVNFCRGNGGYSATGQPSDEPPAPLPRVPDRTADARDVSTTALDMALYYRLNADRNPLHADPDVARAAGFARPILHGLATYGIVGLALLRRWCDADPARMRSLHARFTAPVYPGETLVTESWRDGDRVQFRASAQERGVVVLDNGYSDVA